MEVQGILINELCPSCIITGQLETLVTDMGASKRIGFEVISHVASFRTHSTRGGISFIASFPYFDL